MQISLNTLKIIAIIVASILIIVYLIYAIITSKRRMKKEIIKIDDALNSIDLYLDKKKKYILKTKEAIDLEDYKDNFNDINYDTDFIELFNTLDELEDKFNEVLEKDAYTDNKDLLSIKKKIRNINCNLIASIKFYNDSIEKYYNLKRTWPTRLVKLFCGFKKFETIEIKETNQNG